MVKLGMVGMGFMGQAHFGVHSALDGVQVVAVADYRPERVAAQTPALGGNVGEAVPLDLSAQHRYGSLGELLAAEPGLDCVDLCTPTDLHAPMAIEALEAGKHVICEKPMALAAADCDRMIAAAQAAGRFLFVAQCIRFWPAYEALAELVRAGDLGPVRVAKFSRLSGTPIWSESNWILDPARSGGALLDLHIHDADFVSYLWGLPPAVFAQAASIITPGRPVDHVLTDYLFEDFVCVAEGGWAFHSGFPFTMAYRVIGEAATLAWGVSDGPEPTLYRTGQEPVRIPVAPGTGYQREMRYFCDCMAAGQAPATVTPQGAREAVRLVQAEALSVATGAPVAL